MSKTWKDYVAEVREKGFAKASPIARLIWACEVGDIDQHASDDLIAITDELDALRKQRNDYMDWHVEQGKEIARLRAERKKIADAIKFHLDNGEVPDNLADGVLQLMIEEYYPMVEKIERLQARLAELEANTLPFTSPDPTPITKDEIMAGG